MSIERSTPAAKTPLCAACDYPLIGLEAHRCPECGQPFDPADAATFNATGRPRGRGVRRLLQWPWPVIGFAMVVLGWRLWVLRQPEQAMASVGILKWYGWCGVVVGVGVVLSGLRWIFAAPKGRAAVGGFRRQRRSLWPLLLGMIVVASVGVHLRAPLYAAFYLSRPAMDRMADQAIRIRLGGSIESQTWAGLFPAQTLAHRYPNEAPAPGRVFIAALHAPSETPFRGDWGFARMCNEVRDDVPLRDSYYTNTRLRRLSGDWFVMYADE